MSKTVTRLKFAKTLILLVAVALCVGCGGPARVEAPELDSKAAASEAMALYDQDGDGQLTDSELKASGALLGAKAEIDEDEDGIITEAEIESRIDYFVQGRDGRISLACYVVKGNTPVRGADVRFVPEPFMADMIEGAMGTTNEGGMAIVNMDDCLLYTSPSPRDQRGSRMPSSA